MEQFENIRIGPKYAIRLSDLADWHRLQATCFRCRHTTVIDPAIFRGRYTGDTRLLEIEEKLRCQQCGNRYANNLSVGRMPRG